MIVVDASVAVKWFLPEADSDQALKWLTNKTTFIAPHLIRIEVAAAFTKAVRLNNLHHDDAIDLCETWYDALDAGDISLITLAADFRQAARLSVHLTHPLQDCLYLALAQRFMIPLLSADNKQVKKAQLCGVKTLDFN